ncbi:MULTISPECIES: DUF7859 family protein [Halobellus]|jgi:hypothetical protein|uniref:DUF7859 family protein n=1 Tax=Halobellus TaxID=1073986 RepID=UPI0028806810|nr:MULTISPECIES: hypothetical protein [unclassified Halobellus]
MPPREPGFVDRLRPSTLSPRAQTLPPDGEVAQIDVAVDFVTSNPALVLLLLFLLGFVFFAYLFVRRTLTGLRDGFDDGYRGK